MEGLGKKLQEARLARGLTLDEAGRMTKIRPAQLREIENEDFSQFPSLTYAKGFLLIYGKFLDVDVSPYLEAFETSETLTTDGYSYLQEASEPEPIRAVKVRRRSVPVSSGGGRSSFMPLIIGIIVLVVGFTVMKWLLQMQRLKPRPAPAPGTSPIATATVTETIIAPHAQPVESPTPLPTAETSVAPPAGRFSVYRQRGSWKCAARRWSVGNRPPSFRWRSGVGKGNTSTTFRGAACRSGSPGTASP